MPTINDRIGSQNVIRVLSNASAPPSRVNNLLDINAGRKDDTDSTGLLLIWDKTSAQYVLGNDIAHGLNITGLTTFTRLEATGVTFSGVTTAATLSATTALSMGSTSVISAARQLQNIASLDATTTATIESAIVNAPNTFSDLQVTGISTFIGKSGHVGLATFGGGIDVVAGVSTFAGAIDANAGANIDGGLVANSAKISDLTQANAIVFSGSDGELVETSAFIINSISETLIGQNFNVTSLTASRQLTAALLNVTGVSTFVGDAQFDGNVSIAGTLTYEDVTNVDSVGIVTAGKGVRVTTGGIVVTAGVSTYGAAIDANAGADISGGVGLNVVGHTELDEVNISGVSTYGGAIDANAGADISGGVGLNVVGHAELDNVNVSGVSTFVGVSTFSGDVYVGGDLYLKDDLVLDNITGSSLKITGISTFAGAIDANAGADISGGVGLNVVGHTELDEVNISGVSTYGAAIDANAGADISGGVGLNVVGHTELDNVNVSGVSTFAAAIDANAGADISGGVGLNVVGHTELDNVNISGVTTHQQDVKFPGAAYDIQWDQATSKFKFDDSAQCVFGSASGGDMKIYHTGGNSTIKNETGQFRIAGNDLRLQSQDSSEDYLLAVDGGSVSVFFNDIKRLETSSSGVNVTDTLSVAGVATITGTLTAGLIDGGSY